MRRHAVEKGEEISPPRTSSSTAEAQLDARYARLTAVAAGYLPPSRSTVDEWHKQLAAEVKSSPSTANRGPAVTAFAELIERDGIVRMYVEQMIEQALRLPHDPEKPAFVRDVPELLDALSHIVNMAPAFKPPPAVPLRFPMSSLFVYMMLTTPGEAAFRLGRFNRALRAILREWCAFLDSPQSAQVLNEGPEGWLSSAAFEYNNLDEFEIPDKAKPHWGWSSYNDFFRRQIKTSARPISEPDNPKLIVSANDGTLSTIARQVRRSDLFWLKGQPYSLVDMLNGDEEMVERFVGGDVLQSFLSGSNYHRWHSPVNGVIRKIERIEGLMFSDLEALGYDIKAVTRSLAYEACVNTRGLLYIEGEDPGLGTVCVIPIGITDISSITFTVSEGEEVKKGQELGYFSYGGSTLALVFQPGTVARFKIEAPEYPQPPSIRVNAQIAIAR